MATPNDESFRDEVVIHIVHGIPYQQHVVICNPGDWPEIKATLQDTDGWLEIRYGPCLVVVGSLALTTADAASQPLARGNPLRASTDDAGLV